MRSSENPLSSVSLSIKYKFAIFSTLLITLVCVFLSLFLLEKVEGELKRQIYLRGMSTIKNFSENAKYSIMTRNRTFLSGLVEHEISKEGVMHVIIVDEQGQVLAHNNPSMIGRVVDDSYTQNLLESLTETMVRRFTIPTGETIYDFVTPVLDSDIYTEDRYADPYEARLRLPDKKNLGVIRIGLSFQKMEESMAKTYRGVTYISLGIALTSILLALWYGKILIKPLTEMTRIANRLASGYLDERVEIGSRDEIGLLAQNFNTMAESLQESRSNLWKLNKELEYIVEERTADLKKAYQDLQQIDQLKSSFLSTVSHELRTPLTSILGFAKMIHKQFERNISPHLPPEEKKVVKARDTIRTNLEIIEEESNRLARLINDVLDLAKIESGRMSWSRSEFNLIDLFRKSFHNIQSLVENSPVKLELIGDSEEVGTIYGDPDRIMQVITNLLSNAIKFTTEGTIVARVVRQEEYILASVRDPGIGIDEQDLLKIFDKFQQVGDTMTEKPQGTGLGLPISREIVEHHKGHIWAESQPGKGSTFSFALPLEHDQPVPEKVKEASFQLQSRLDKMSRSEYMILIADEDPTIRDLLQGSLEQEGYRTIQAVNGKEAYDLAREYPVSAILIDIMMYEIDGFDTPHYLKADEATSNIPIILLSIIMNQQEKMCLGATSYATTPLTAEKVLTRFTDIHRDQDISITDARFFFFGFSRAVRKDYLSELQNLGATAEHFDVFTSLLKAAETNPPSLIFVDFREAQVGPNDLFQTLRNHEKLKHIPLIAMIHETHIARRIDQAPIKGLSTVEDIAATVNELFKRRRMDGLL
jgi:signal transduction histidine kinase/ActR/RegA family two-component response regulator